MMTQRLKRWESPRRQGRNRKGKGGSARRRQLKKQLKLLRRKLKGETIQAQGSKPSSKSQSQSQRQGREKPLPSFWGFIVVQLKAEALHKAIMLNKKSYKFYYCLIFKLNKDDGH